MPLAACVLAAGASRRMGTPKALLQVAGVTYVERLLGTYRSAGVAPCWVVGRAEDTTLEALCAAHGARLLVNPDPGRGMLSSLHVCLRRLAADAAAGAPRIDGLFVSPVDCPRVRPETLSALRQAFLASGAPIVVPRHGARRGHPTLFSAALFEELLRAPLELGARAVVWAHAADRIEVPVEDAAVLDDIDTPEDARQVEGGEGAA